MGDDGQTRVLVVDDDPQVRSLVAAVLDTAGYRVVTVENGVEAVRQLDEIPFALVVLDGEMPQLSGIEVLRRTRELGLGIPVIFMTARPSLEGDARAAGASAFLRKPFAISELLKAAEALLEGRG